MDPVLVLGPFQEESDLSSAHQGLVCSHQAQASTACWCWPSLSVPPVTQQRFYWLLKVVL